MERRKKRKKERESERGTDEPSGTSLPFLTYSPDQPRKPKVRPLRTLDEPRLLREIWRRTRQRWRKRKKSTRRGRRWKKVEVEDAERGERMERKWKNQTPLPPVPPLREGEDWATVEARSAMTSGTRFSGASSY